jgi:hypothetical protein
MCATIRSIMRPQFLKYFNRMFFGPILYEINQFRDLYYNEHCVLLILTGPLIVFIFIPTKFT